MKKEFYHFSFKSAFLLSSIGFYLLAGQMPVLAKDQTNGTKITVSVPDVTALVTKVQPNVKDAKGWATDMVEALKARNIPVTRKHVCTVMGIVKLESGFEADPVRVSLGTKAIAALNKRLQKLPKVIRGKMEHWLHVHPNKDHNYYDRIGKATTERQLDLTYRDLVADMLGGRLKGITKFKTVGGWIARLNAIDSIGAMQIAVSLVVKEEQTRLGRTLKLAEIWQLRDRLYQRRGSLYFGVTHLLGHETGSTNTLYRFADYVAGRYASRNAAFQAMIATLSGQKLVLDGDLLRYRKSGKPTLRRGNTEKAVRLVSKKYGLKLGLLKIRSDLKKEKQARFTTTQTWHKIRTLYQKSTGKPTPLVMMPESQIRSDKKISYTTTEGYANHAHKTFEQCMGGSL